MSTDLEIERKFRVKGPLPDLTQLDFIPLRQGYISTGDTEVRLREAKGIHTLTCKQGNGLVRHEVEIVIGSDEFEKLWPLTESARITKTRYHMPCNDRLIELDIFTGDLEGLVLAEIEFASELASQQFVFPEWFGAEVTDDKRYKNKALAVGRRVPTPA